MLECFELLSNKTEETTSGKWKRKQTTFVTQSNFQHFIWFESNRDFCFQKPFDAEELTECKFLIRGTSSDGNGQTQLIVKIIDENDHAPAFSQLLYLGHIKEGLPEDSPVIGGDGKALAIQASDADVSGSDLMYEVVGCSMFTIDSQSGELMTAEVKRILREEFHLGGLALDVSWSAGQVL